MGKRPLGLSAREKKVPLSSVSVSGQMGPRGGIFFSPGFHEPFPLLFYLVFSKVLIGKAEYEEHVKRKSLQQAKTMFYTKEFTISIDLINSNILLRTGDFDKRQK